jgi:energy-coupling factor transporter ATP-binding protein EcfA2
VKWYELYLLLAKNLEIFYHENKNKEKTVGELFYDRCIEFENGKFFDLFNWGKNITEHSIDPFHIFASFNNTGITMNAKWQRMQFYFKILKQDVNVIDALIDNRTFVPHIVIVHVVANRNKNHQNQIWEFFIAIMKSDEIGIKKGFVSSLTWFGIAFTVITEFLFWINSKQYLSLDKNTLALLKRYKLITKHPINYNQYMELIHKIHGFGLNEETNRILVSYAYNEQLPMDMHTKNILLRVLNQEDVLQVSQTKISELKNTFPLKFQLVAIKVLNKCEKKYSKTLLQNHLYQFSNKFEFSKDDLEVKYYKNRDTDLHDLHDLSINLNVIVGKNGSGKSTLIELVFMVINNLSIKKISAHKRSSEIEYIDHLFAELYFVTDHLYKISVSGNIVSIEQYQQLDNTAEFIKFGNKIIFTKDFQIIDDLFYTIHLNYSLHSLNQNYFGNWLFHLFHKNDGYKTPIVLEPYRENGIIDINTQMLLTKERLLANLINAEIGEKRQLTKKSNAIKIRFLPSYEKFNTYDYVDEIAFNELIKTLGVFYGYDYIQDYNNCKKEGRDCKSLSSILLTAVYIFNKLISMCSIYDEYKQYKLEIEQGKYSRVLKAIKNDKSHAAFKIKRAINFLSYNDHLEFPDFFDQYIEFELDDLSARINSMKASVERTPYMSQELSTEELIPPSIYKSEIVFQDGNTFESLSSGEKQKIFVLNAITYHLKNIASIDNGFKHVNIVLDEIELYFHPEMQKDFISDLFANLESNTYIRNLASLNFIFVTHSPFILSDVSNSNLLALDEHAVPHKQIKSTFAANIYELLTDLTR